MNKLTGLQSHCKPEPRLRRAEYSDLKRTELKIQPRMIEITFNKTNEHNDFHAVT